MNPQRRRVLVLQGGGGCRALQRGVGGRARGQPNLNIAKCNNKTDRFCVNVTNLLDVTSLFSGCYEASVCGDGYAATVSRRRPAQEFANLQLFNRNVTALAYPTPFI